jgi:hypothetical protein
MFEDVHVSGRGSSSNWTPEKAFRFSGTGYVQILCRWPHRCICSVMLNGFQVSYHSRKGQQQQGLGRRSAKMRHILLKYLLHDYLRVAMCEVAGNALMYRVFASSTSVRTSVRNTSSASPSMYLAELADTPFEALRTGLSSYVARL